MYCKKLHFSVILNFLLQLFFTNFFIIVKKNYKLFYVQYLE